MSSYSSPDKADAENVARQKQKELLIASFASGATSSDVEVVFSFDTTGSMYSCLQEVRREIGATVERLLRDIPGVRIGIIAHGDYCDASSSSSSTTTKNTQNCVSVLDFSNDPKKIVNFIEKVQKTNGDDAPECYEYALRKATTLSWTSTCHNKALVIIGDDIPHPPSYTNLAISWKSEMYKLKGMGIKVYGVQALSNRHAKPFYQHIADVTGGVYLNFKDFTLITDMFLAICYREFGGDQLETYRQEVVQQGRMNSGLMSIFKALSNQIRERFSPTANQYSNLRYAWWDAKFDTVAQHPSYVFDEQNNTFKKFEIKLEPVSNDDVSYTPSGQDDVATPIVTTLTTLTTITPIQTPTPDFTFDIEESSPKAKRARITDDVITPSPQNDDELNVGSLEDLLDNRRSTLRPRKTPKQTSPKFKKPITLKPKKGNDDVTPNGADINYELPPDEMISPDTFVDDVSDDELEGKIEVLKEKKTRGRKRKAARKPAIRSRTPRNNTSSTPESDAESEIPAITLSDLSTPIDDESTTPTISATSSSSSLNSNNNNNNLQAKSPYFSSFSSLFAAPSFFKRSFSGIRSTFSPASSTSSFESSLRTDIDDDEDGYDTDPVVHEDEDDMNEEEREKAAAARKSPESYIQPIRKSPRNHLSPNPAYTTGVVHYKKRELAEGEKARAPVGSIVAIRSTAGNFWIAKVRGYHGDNVVVRWFDGIRSHPDYYVRLRWSDTVSIDSIIKTGLTLEHIREIGVWKLVDKEDEIRQLL